MVISSIAGLPWGAVGVAASYSITFLLVVTPLLFWFVGRKGPVRTVDFYRAIAPSAGASVSVLLALLALREWAPVSQPLPRLAASVSRAGVVSLTVLAILPAGRRSLYDLREFITLLTKRSEVRTAI